MATFDKALLFAPRLPELDFEVAGLGTVRIRSLSREEVLAMRNTGLGVAGAEQKMVSAAMVDPPLTEDEVRQWQAACAPGEMEPLTEAIATLSGLNMEAAKTAAAGFRG